MNFIPSAVHTHQDQQGFVTFSKPQIIGYMSVDGNREYHSDLSELKFLTSIPKGRVSLDLNHNIDNAIKRTTDTNNEQISLLLKCIVDQKANITQYLNQELQFIMYRRSLINIMCNASIISKDVNIVASLYNNHIYFWNLETVQEKKRRLSITPREKKFCAWGYKFEQYLVSDQPNMYPRIQKPVIENAEFSINYYSTLGQHKILYNAQIDGMLATDRQTPRPPVTNNFQDNLNYLRNNRYVELKTNRKIDSLRQEQNFRINKLLWCWCQCYLADLEGVLMGYRTDNGIIQEFDWFETQDIVEYCKDMWNPQTALEHLDSFLTFVKSCFKKEIEKTPSEQNTNSKRIITLQFNIENKTTRVCNYDGDPILPQWYVDSM